MQTYAEQRAAYEATRATSAARMKAIMDEAAAKGETLEAAAQEEFDGLEKDIEAIDAQVKRLKTLEALNAPVEVKGGTPEEGAASRNLRPTVQVKGNNIPPGIGFVRLIGAKYLAQQHFQPPAEIAKQMWPDMPELQTVLRAAVTPGNTSDSTFASPLVEYQNLASEFVDLLRPATIIGRIPGLTRVPFNVKIPRATTDPTVNWVGEGKVKPVSSMAFDSITLDFTKVAGIVPITEELLRFASPSAEMLIRNALVAAVAYLTDRDFLDPTKAEAVGVSPASITNGVTPITATGTTADALRDDLGTLLSEYAEANMSLSGLVLVMTAQQAIKIALMRNSLGQREFEGITRDGGNLEGIPVIISENIVATGGSPVDGGLIVAINAPEILLADEGQVNIDMSREASLQMETTPDSPATQSTVLTSLWQHNMVAFRAERMIHWKARRTGAVQFIQSAKYA
jgi:HK97 family phage major capsid protein